ncbi:hypothetical protein [Streptomyces sp. NPDC059631]|uniref:hypothetical protein n=1 Tax=unclassified Streptomyces TaxID=2593676 RepID=UPI0036B15C28
MTVPATRWQPGMLITAGRLLASDLQKGTALVSFTNQTSWTQQIAFPEAYPSTPSGVTTQILSGAGPTARWDSRAFTVTPTGFTLFCFVTDAANTPVTWSSIPVYWEARF